RNMDKGRNEQERWGKRIPAVKRKMQATANDQRNSCHSWKLRTASWGNWGTYWSEPEDHQVKSTRSSPCATGHLRNLEQTLNSCRENVSELRSLLVEIKTTASVGEDAAAEEEDAEGKEEDNADTDAAGDNDPAAEEDDAAVDAAEFMWW
ncbi:hypothetical protein EJB05_40122, partial [Eragrostis curvula]